MMQTTMMMTEQTSSSLQALSSEPVREDIPAQIPDRFFFRIGDVSEITGIKPYVLRFWEKEFDLLHPIKNAAGQRVYRKSDVESVLLIKRLLYLERFSIEGAKKRLKDLRKNGELASAKKSRGEMNEEKLSILADLKRDIQDLISFVA